MITICIATYNGEEFIHKQILSILNQIGIDDEVLISDDNSTDNTLEIIKNINDHRIHIFSNNFRSPIKNFEFLIKKSTGDIIFLSDQDDIWEYNKVQAHLSQYKQNPLTGLVISNINLIDKYDISINREFYKKAFTSKIYYNLFYNNYIGCSISFKNTLKKYLIPFPKNIPMHDWWIGVISSIFSNVIYLNEKLVCYRIHENNFTNINNYSLLKKCIMRLRFLYYIIIRTLKFKL